MNRLQRILALAALAGLLGAPAAAAARWGIYMIHNVSGAPGSWTMRLTNGTSTGAFFVDVGPDCAYLRVETGTDTHGGRGNCDLYLYYQSHGNRIATSTRPNSQMEVVEPAVPAPGRYYIRLYGRTHFRTCIRIVVMNRTTWRAGGWRTDVLDLVNWERAIRGLVRLAVHPRLQRAAQYHAIDQLRHRLLGHTGSSAANRTLALRLAAQGYRYRRAAESVSRNLDPTIAALGEWLENAADRSRLLNPLMRHVGFGWAQNAAQTDSRIVAVLAIPR